MNDKKEGEWDFDGSCAPKLLPSGEWTRGQGETFTLGVFQWLGMKSGKGLKRGRVIKRFHGTRHDPKTTYDAAAEYVRKLNNGETQ
jgi:hypothetical protein